MSDIRNEEHHIIELKKVEVPLEVEAGQPFDLAIEFVLKKKALKMNHLGVHLHRSSQPSFEDDPDRINADCRCSCSDSWEVGVPVRIEVISPTILSSQPPGEYLISIIFWHQMKNEDGTTTRYNYLYTNPDIGKDNVLAHIKIK